MWEQLKVYRQLDKKEINPTFKKFGKEILTYLKNYSIDQTSSIIKLYKVHNGLEQAVFIEKTVGSYNLKVSVCIKPIDFYVKHRFTMLAITPLGEIMNSYRRSHYPLTQEWRDLAFYLVERIKNEIEQFFQRYDSFEKIISHRLDIEPKALEWHNKYELLIYAAIKTRNTTLLNFYINKKLTGFTGLIITHSEYLKPDPKQINEIDFLNKIKLLGLTGDFDAIENEIRKVS